MCEMNWSVFGENQHCKTGKIKYVELNMLNEIKRKKKLAFLENDAIYYY